MARPGHRLVTPQGTIIDEGNFDVPCPPYQLPYRAITPVRDQCRNLLVPVCLSATHVGYAAARRTRREAAACWSSAASTLSAKWQPRRASHVSCIDRFLW